MAKGSQKATWLELGRAGKGRRCDVCCKTIKVGEIAEVRQRAPQFEVEVRGECCRCWPPSWNKETA